MRLGVIGLGLIAQAVHLQNLQTLREKYQVTHVCDLSATLAAQVAAEYGGPVRHSTDAAEVLADPEVDAVLILTPGTHAYLARRALEAGKHVLAEKPFAHTTAECLELDALAAAKGLVLQVAYMKMYDPIMARARAELASLGALRARAGDRAAPRRRPAVRPPAPPALRRRRPHRRRHLLRAGEGGPRPSATSASRTCRSTPTCCRARSCTSCRCCARLFGEQPLTIAHAQAAGLKPGVKLEEPPQLQALGTLGDAQLSLSWNWLPDFPDYGEEIAVFGSAGRLYLSMPGPYLRDARAELVVESMQGGERATTRLVSDHRTGFVHELLAFHASVTEGAPVLSTATGAAYDTAALQQIARSLA
ncbi:Gfo/Idh/MocA family oxidoreductase [Nonomuraea dietziae]|uniref:Gfo/Idh/MocA family protein n=1 Tax=Nonomuraea dietziae TaxID=65515 RepID=UPI0031D7169B